MAYSDKLDCSKKLLSVCCDARLLLLLAFLDLLINSGKVTLQLVSDSVDVKREHFFVSLDSSLKHWNLA